MIPFSPPRIDQEIIDAVVAVLRSGWITTGPKVKEFETELAKYAGVSHVRCVSSATAGLELMLRWFGIGPGDEVIVPAYTYCATANVVLHTGAKPVMVDIGSDLNIDTKLISRLITPKTKAIIPVDIAGMPCDYDSINKIVNESAALFKPSGREQETLGRILILSDAAHSIGAVYKGKKVGALADITVYSFHAVKNLTTAEGGAICLNLPAPFDNDGLHRRLGVLTLHGQSKDAFSKAQSGGWEYDVEDAGYKANMTDILAAMGLVELKRYDKENLKRRREIFKLYSGKLSGYSWAQLPEYETADCISAFHVYPLRINGISQEQRDKIIDLITRKGVSVNVHFKPLPLLSVYKNLGYDIMKFPAAQDAWAREITLPVYYQLTDEHAGKVVEAVAESVELCITT